MPDDGEIVPPTRRSRLAATLRGAACVLIFGAAFVGVALGLAPLAPFPEVPVIKEKYEYFARHREDFDLIFMGSSRFYYQIIPPEFDAGVQAASGREVHSFSCAVSGAWPPESYYFLRKILALKSHRLKWVVIDAMEIKAGLSDFNQPTTREVYWHDWAHTRMALAGITVSPYAWAVEHRDALKRAHLFLFARHLVNLGRGAELVGRALEQQRAKGEREPEWMARAGFHATSPVPMKPEAVASFTKAVEELRQNMPPWKPSAPFEEAMAGMIADVRRAGAEPVYVLPPTISRLENWSAIPGGVVYIPLNDPNRYPELYDPAVHFDDWHLNEKGAHLFTRELAARFAESLQDKGKGSPSRP